MVEKLELFDLKGKLIGIHERKKIFQEAIKEYRKKGSVSKQLKRVCVLLMNSSGRIYLQKRSKLKDENSGLYDKTVGGHVSAGDSYDLTLIKECAEELGFPASILSENDFKVAVKKTDLSIIGIFRLVEELNKFDSVRISTDDSKFVQPYITATYIGYYDGAIKFVDGESSGIEVFSLDELEQEMKTNPDKFTEDVKFMINRYKKYLKSID